MQIAEPRVLASLAAACVLIFCVALIPTFRSGFATVTGTGSDAHQVTGAATFVQHNYPSSTNEAYPVDEVRAIWNSKYPIFYALAGVSSLSGLEPWEAMMSVLALLLAMTALGLFLFARRVLLAGRRRRRARDGSCGARRSRSSTSRCTRTTTRRGGSSRCRSRSCSGTPGSRTARRARSGCSP